MKLLGPGLSLLGARSVGVAGEVVIQGDYRDGTVRRCPTRTSAFRQTPGLNSWPWGAMLCPLALWPLCPCTCGVS